MLFIEPTPEQYNSFVIQNHGSLQQSWQWGDLQERMRRPVKRYLVAGETGKPLLVASFVRHGLPLGKFYWLCPKGPVVNQESGIGNQELWKMFAKELQGIFIRIEPELSATFNFELSTLNFCRAPKDHNPRATVLIDLTKSEDELLSAMHPKTRYNLRVAQKKELRIKNHESRKEFEEFWELAEQTARRDQFHLHPKNYYAELLKMPEIKLFLAYASQKLIAGALVSFFAETAVYLHGASDYDFRQLMAPYLLHWEIIRQAKAGGMKNYDFGGVAPQGESDHPWAGITRFKAGFGGRYIEYLGSFDFVLDKFWYHIYKLGRKILL